MRFSGKSGKKIWGNRRFVGKISGKLHFRAKNFAGKSDFPVPEPFRPQIRTQAAAAVAQDLSLDDINEEIKAVRDGK